MVKKGKPSNKTETSKNVKQRKGHTNETGKTSKMVKEQSYKFLSHWYNTNGEESCNVLWIDKMIENHAMMKEFFGFVLSEYEHNPDNSILAELRFISFVSMSGLTDHNEKDHWYLQAAINFMAKCFFGDDEDHEDNLVPLKNHHLRKQLENINQMPLKDIDVTTILPMVFIAAKNIAEDSRFEKKYTKFKKTVST